VVTNEKKSRDQELNVKKNRSIKKKTLESVLERIWLGARREARTLWRKVGGKGKLKKEECGIEEQNGNGGTIGRMRPTKKTEGEVAGQKSD